MFEYLALFWWNIYLFQKIVYYFKEAYDLYKNCEIIILIKSLFAFPQALRESFDSVFK